MKTTAHPLRLLALGGAAALAALNPSGNAHAANVPIAGTGYNIDGLADADTTDPTTTTTHLSDATFVRPGQTTAAAAPAPGVGALTLEISPDAWLFNSFARPAAPQRVRRDDACDQDLSDRFTRHDVPRAGNDEAAARPEDWPARMLSAPAADAPRPPPVAGAASAANPAFAADMLAAPARTRLVSEAAATWLGDSGTLPVGPASPRPGGPEVRLLRPGKAGRRTGSLLPPTPRASRRRRCRRWGRSWLRPLPPALLPTPGATTPTASWAPARGPTACPRW